MRDLSSPVVFRTRGAASPTRPTRATRLISASPSHGKRRWKTSGRTSSWRSNL